MADLVCVVCELAHGKSAMYWYKMHGTWYEHVGRAMEFTLCLAVAWSLLLAPSHTVYM
jgi:hypothetical protein